MLGSSSPPRRPRVAVHPAVLHVRLALHVAPRPLGAVPL